MPAVQGDPDDRRPSGGEPRADPPQRHRQRAAHHRIDRSPGNPQFVPFLATQVDGSLDGNFSVRATEQVTFSLKGVNLAGARQYTFNDSQARFGEINYYGRTILFGVRAAF